MGDEAAGSRIKRIPAAIRAKLDLDWDRFFTEFQKDVKLWLVCVACLQLARLAFVASLRRYMAEETGALSSLTAVLAAMLNGVRFDSMVAGWWVFFPFWASVAAGFFDITRFTRRFRLGFAIAFVAATTILCRVAVGYYEEFGDVFNYWVFGLVYDDAGAVVETVWAQYNVPFMALITALVVVGAVFSLRWFLRTGLVSEERLARVISTRGRRAWFRGGASVVIVLAYFVALRGSVGMRPVQRKDAGVTRDAFLNKATLNPYSALYYAVREHRRISRADGLDVYLPDGDLLAAARYVFGEKGGAKGGAQGTAASPLSRDLDRWMLKRARGPKLKERPKHVFVIVMESYDSWTMLPQYEALHAADRLKALARDGLWVKSFLPASTGTMTSLAAIITGLPDAGVLTNYRPTAAKLFPSSVADTFRRLGYRPRLFYSGYLTWQRIGEFCRRQGFEDIYGGAHMGSWAVTNEWGVRDEDIFEFTAGKLDDSFPSFNLVLTTTNHPPYDIDVHEKGYPVREVPADLAALFDSGVGLEIIGHHWYSDLCLGEFVERVMREHPSSVFAITGDHFSRKHIRANPGLYEGYSVPFVLCGNGVPDVLGRPGSPRAPAGSHIDIGPTLVELIAPEGFEYHSMGHDILVETARPYGVARGRVIGRDFIFDATGSLAFEPIPGCGPPDACLPDARVDDLKMELKRLHDAMHALAWWRTMRGPEFEAKAGKE